MIFFVIIIGILIGCVNIINLNACEISKMILLLVIGSATIIVMLYLVILYVEAVLYNLKNESDQTGS